MENTNFYNFLTLSQWKRIWSRDSLILLHIIHTCLYIIFFEVDSKSIFFPNKPPKRRNSHSKNPWVMTFFFNINWSVFINIFICNVFNEIIFSRSIIRESSIKSSLKIITNQPLQRTQRQSSFKNLLSYINVRVNFNKIDYKKKITKLKNDWQYLNSQICHKWCSKSLLYQIYIRNNMNYYSISQSIQ